VGSEMCIRDRVALLYVLRCAQISLLKFRIAEMWHRLHESTLLLLIAVMDMVLMTVDQLVILRFFSKQQYGVYALGMASSWIAISLVSVFQNTIEVRIMGLTGEGRQPEAHRLVDSSVTLYLFFAVAALSMLIPAMAVVVKFYLPKYAGGIPVYVLLAGFSLARGPAILLRPFYLARNREKRLFSYQILAISVAAVLDGIVLLLGGGLTGVATASFCGYMLISSLMLRDFERQCTGESMWSKYVILGFGFASMIVAVLLFRNHSFPGTFVAYMVQVFCGGALYLLVLLGMGLMMRGTLVAAARPFLHE